MNNSSFWVKIPRQIVSLLGFFFAVSFPPISSAADLSSSNQKIEVGLSASVEVGSNVYSLRDLARNNTNQPKYAPSLQFVRGGSVAGIYAAERGCTLILGALKMGAATVNRETLSAYVGYDSSGIALAPGETINLRYQHFAVQGNGATYGCDFFRNNNRLHLAAKLSNVQTFQLKNYRGSLTKTDLGIDSRVRESWWSTNAPLGDLQDQFDQGRLLALDAKYEWIDSRDRWYGRAYIQNVLSRISLTNIAFLNRTLDATIGQGTIFQRERVSPVTGSYGNTKLQTSLPRLWDTEIGLKSSQNQGVALTLTGVNDAYQAGIAFDFGCLSLCRDRERNYRVGIDQTLKILSVSVSSNDWRLGLGFRLSEGISWPAMVSLQLGMRY